MDKKMDNNLAFESFLEHVQLQYGEYLGPVIALPMKPMNSGVHVFYEQVAVNLKQFSHPGCLLEKLSV